jgi:hypothetical protein
MGRHTEAAETSAGLRRTARLSGLVGGLAWVATAFIGDGTGRDVLLWGGGVLITLALFGLGLLMVKSDVLLLRVFVALALPTLVWGVVALLRESVVSLSLVDAVFGGAVALFSAAALGRRTRSAHDSG